MINWVGVGRAGITLPTIPCIFIIPLLFVGSFLETFASIEALLSIVSSSVDLSKKALLIAFAWATVLDAKYKDIACINWLSIVELESKTPLFLLFGFDKIEVFSAEAGKVNYIEVVKEKSVEEIEQAFKE